MYNAEHGVSLTAIPDGLVNDSVFGRNLVCGSFLEVGHSSVVSAVVYLRESLIE